MSRPRNAYPKLCTDKTGRCFCKVDGKFVTLGRDGDPETQRRYGELLASLATATATKPSSGPPRSGLTVNELCVKFITEVLPKYQTSDGQPSAEQACFKGVIRILRRLFGETPAAEFGPVKLRLARSEMVETGWARKHINKQVCRLRYIFKFAVSWELVPPSIVDSLKTVPGLEAGHTKARETTPKTSVPAESLQAVRAELLPRHQDVFDLMLLTGARPGELLGLQMRDLNRSGSPWRSDLRHHKTARKGKSRTLYFNGKAQAILLKYLKADPEAKLLPTTRKTFSDAIGRACGRAGVERFTAHTLRHCVATRITNELGLEAAQRLLGHSSAAMTAHYAKQAEAKAVEASAALG